MSLYRKLLIIASIVLLFSSNIWSKKTLTLDLDEAISLALKHNLQIVAAREKLIEAYGSTKEAKSARYFTLELAANYTKLNEAPSATMKGVNVAHFYSPTLGINPQTTLPNTIDNLQPIPLWAYLNETFGTNFSPLNLPSELNHNYVVSKEFSHPFKFSDTNIYNVKLTLTQPIYTFGRIENAINIAKLTYKIGNYEYEKIKQEVILKVKDAYFSVLRTKHFVEVAEAAKESAKKHVEMVNKLYKEGVVAKYDLLRAEVALADVEQRLITARNGLKLAKVGLVTILGIQFNPEAEDIEIKEVEEYKLEEKVVKVEELIDRAYNRRVEIMQLQEKIKIATCAVRLAKATNKPTIALVGNFEYKKGDTLPAKWNDYYNVTLAVSFPFFDVGKTSGKVTQAKSQLAQAINGLEQLKQVVALEVRQAYLDLRAAEEKIIAAKKSIEQAKEGLRLAEERYKYGISTEVEVIDARTALIEAQTNYYNAIYEYQIALAKLQKAIG